MSTNPFTSRQFQSSANDQQRPQNGLSYVSGTTQDPLRFITVPTLLDEAVMNHGSRDAVISLRIASAYPGTISNVVQMK